MVAGIPIFFGFLFCKFISGGEFMYKIWGEICTTGTMIMRLSYKFDEWLRYEECSYENM